MSQDSPEWCFEEESRRVCFNDAAAAPAAASDDFTTEVHRAVSIKADCPLTHDHVALAEHQTLVSSVPEKSAVLAAPSAGIMGLLLPPSAPLASAALPHTAVPVITSALPAAPISQPLSALAPTAASTNPSEEEDLALFDMSSVLGDIDVPAVLQPQPAPQVLTPDIMSLLAPSAPMAMTAAAAAATTATTTAPPPFPHPSSSFSSLFSSVPTTCVAPPPLPSESSTPFSLSWSSFHVQGLEWRALMSSLRAVLDQQGISSVAGGCEWQLCCTFPSSSSGLCRRKPSFNVSVYASAELAYAVEFKLAGGAARPFRSAFKAVVAAFESLTSCTVQTIGDGDGVVSSPVCRGDVGFGIADAGSIGSPLPSHPKMTVLE